MEQQTKCGYVGIMGLPNAGKSTFINTLIKEKISIVSDKSQTTRDMNIGILTRESVQIGFLDLPGVHKPKHELNRRMMKIVHQGLDDSDLILHIVDATSKKFSGDKYISHLIKQKELPYILVVNKIDLVNKHKLIEKLERFQHLLEPDEMIPISALTGENTDRLLELITPHLPDSEFLFPLDEYTNQSVRTLVKETVRERVLHYTRDEIPHATTVELEEFTFDEEEDCFFIAAMIYVEKPSQRRILIGSNGSMIKKMKNGLNNKLKKILLKPVYCELHVKVKKDWRNLDSFLDRLH
ncbi:MAG: GTPase Era [Acidobacteria bacterium]|nr:MAG: GTPase Era [Acidobacteriota bacterium]